MPQDLLSKVGVGGACAIVLNWLLKTCFGVYMDEYVTAAAASLFSLLLPALECATRRIFDRFFPPRSATVAPGPAIDPAPQPIPEVKP